MQLFSVILFMTREIRYHGIDETVKMISVEEKRNARNQIIIKDFILSQRNKPEAKELNPLKVNWR